MIVSILTAVRLKVGEVSAYCPVQDGAMLRTYDEATHAYAVHRRLVRLTQAHDGEQLASFILNHDQWACKDHVVHDPSATYPYQLVPIPSHDGGELQLLPLVQVGAQQLLGRAIVPRG